MDYATVERKGVGSKLALLELAEKLGNVAKACRTLGYSRDSFYRFKKRFETGGAAALENLPRKRPTRANRVPPAVEELVLELAHVEPLWGQARVALELSRRGMKLSPAGVRAIWLRHGLQTARHRLQQLNLIAPPRETDAPQSMTRSREIALARG